MISNKIKNIIKYVLLFTFILFASVFFIGNIVKFDVFASSAQTNTDASKERKIDDAKDWTSKVNEDGKVVVHQSSAKTLKEILQEKHPDQIASDGSLYVTLDDLHTIPSLFCSAKGVGLPGYNSTVVRSGGMETDTTDQGKKTAFLTVDDLNGATAFRNQTSWTGYTSSGPNNQFEETTSKTYGRFNLKEVRKATPAEAWVLVEMDKNLPGSVSDMSFEPTDKEYTGSEADITNTLEINGTTIYAVGETGEEQYLEKRGNKYYYVEIVNPSGGGDATYSYVQYAWWKVKTVGENVAAVADLDGGLVAEAEAFEDYVLEAAGKKNVSELERNEDDTFKIDYKVSMTPEKSEDVTVRFDADTNKYLVGPFTVNYLRACTQQGNRAKVSFSGIKSSILVGTNAEGKEVLDSEGNSILQRGTNYRFVYSDENAHKTKQEGFGDTDEDYPYPYDGEEFYIEMDYLDDVVSLKNFKFDFQYMTANGSYELFEGEYLTIHWEPMADVRAKLVSSSSGGASLDFDNSVAISNRIDPDKAAGNTSAFSVQGTYHANVDFDKIEGGYLEGNNFYIDIQRNGEPVFDGDKIKYTGKVVLRNENNFMYGLKISSVTWSLEDGQSGNAVVSSGNTFTFEAERQEDAPMIDSTLEVTASGSFIQKSNMPLSLNTIKVSATETGHIKYYNQVLNGSGIIKITPKAANVTIEDGKIYHKGALDPDEVVIDWDAYKDGKSALERQYINYAIPLGSSFSDSDIDVGQVCLHGSSGVNGGEIIVKDDTGKTTEKITWRNIYVPKFSIDEHDQYEKTVDASAGGESITVYNCFKDTGEMVFEPSDQADAIKALFSSGQTYITVTRTNIVKSQDGTVTVTVTDGCGNSCVLHVNYEGGSASSPTGSPSTQNMVMGAGYEYSYRYYLVADSASSSMAQTQINASGTHERINIDAENGLETTVSGVPVEVEFFTEPINLRTHLSGMVWIEKDEQKDQSIGTLGVKDSAEKYADDNSVEIVVWKVKYQKDGDKLTEVERTKAIAWDEEGKKIDFIDNRIYIKDGKYFIPEIQVPAEEGLDTSKYVMSYDVEFVYDGQTYEATEYLKSSGKDSVSDKLAEFKKTAEETKGEDSDYSKIKGTSAKTDYSLDSYIVENADERKDFDSYFTEFYGSDSTSGNPGNSPINEDGTTNGKATGGAGQSQYNYVEKGEEANKTADLHYTSIDKGDSDADTKKVSTLITHDEKGFVYDQYKFAARTSEGGLVFPYETKYHVEKEYYDNLTFQNNAYKPVDEYFNQINLGLLERYHTDISVLKDLYKAKVVVDEQETDYTYNSLGALTEDSINKTVLAGYREKTYNIGLYNADYKYRSSVYNTITDPITKTVLKAIKDETELRLFVTYKVQIYNGSEYTDVSINEFKDYYDDSLTMVGLETDNKNITGYISTSNQSEQARAEQVLAEKPYARKLVANKDVSKLYKWNKTDDLSNEYIDKLESDNTKLAILGQNDENDLKFEKIESGKDGYKAARCTGLSALSSDKKSVNGDLMLEPGEVYEIYITYEVDQSGYKQIQDAKAADPNNAEAGKDVERKALLDDKKNIFEVSRYTSAYTQEGVNRHKTTSYKAGQISGRVDRDSAPDNVNMSLTNADDKSKVNSKYFEDDTEAAPVVHVGLKTSDEERSLNGVVWEDLRKNNEEADGKYDENTEKGIKDIDVTMVEKINVTGDDLARIQEYINNNQTTLTDEQKAQFNALEKLDYEFEYVWPDNTFEGYSSKTVSGNDGKYEFKNFVAGNYVVRFEYGNKSETLKYNGQDYRNTAYQTGMTNAKALTQKDDEKKIYNGTTDGLGVEAGKVSTLNNQWHDLSSNEQANEMNNARVSDARDYEPRRLMVDAYSRTITNKNAEVLAAYTDEADTNLTNEYKAKLAENNAELIANTSMVANTAKFVVDIEKQSEIKYEENSDNTEGANVSENEVKHQYVIGNMDFGLVRRAETRIYTQKEISKIELLKNDGKEVVLSVSCDDEGNIIKAGGTTDENKTVRVDKITEINKETLAKGTQGFKYVAVEASYLKGLQVKLTYKITVTNKSEKDYTTEYVANIKNAAKAYETAKQYQSGEIGVLNKENNYSPFNTGKGIIYGQYVGLHYYTNGTEATEDKDLTEKYKFAYNGQNKDVIVKTTVDQIIDYIDNDISISKGDTESIANQTWVESSAKDREEKLSTMSYIENTDKTDTNNVKDDNLVDNKGRKYVGTGKNNIVLTGNENMTAEPVTITYQKSKLIDNEEPATELLPSGEIAPQLEDKTVVMYTTINDSVVSSTVSKYNTEFTKELDPGDKTSISIVTTAQASEEAIKNMNYDNLMEIVMYSNPVGRRDTTAIPGNANMIAKQEAAYKAGYDRIYEDRLSDEKKNTLPTEAKEVVEGENGDKKTYYFLAKEVEIADSKSETGKKTVTTERDAYAAKDTVTFSEPTGLSLERQKANMAIRIILLSLIIAAIGIMIATVVVVFRKTKYDDTDLLSDDRK